MNATELINQHNLSRYIPTDVRGFKRRQGMSELTHDQYQQDQAVIIQKELDNIELITLDEFRTAEDILPEIPQGKMIKESRIGEIK